VVQVARQQKLKEEQELLQVGPDASIAHVLQLTQELKESILKERDLCRREAHMAWRLNRWELHEKRRQCLQVRWTFHINYIF
jgi:hypothetical protein